MSNKSGLAVLGARLEAGAVAFAERVARAVGRGLREGLREGRGMNPVALCRPEKSEAQCQREKESMAPILTETAGRSSSVDLAAALLTKSRAKTKRIGSQQTSERLSVRARSKQQ